MNEPDSLPKSETPGFWRSRYAVGLFVMGAIATYFLASEQRAHFIGALPLLLLLACPLMHVFMHNGNGSHGGGRVQVVTAPKHRPGYPSLDLLSNNSGHLWPTLLGEKGDAHFRSLHIASYMFLGYGFYVLSTAWNVLYHAQRHNRLATTDVYARIRHSERPLTPMWNAPRGSFLPSEKKEFPHQDQHFRRRGDGLPPKRGGPAPSRQPCGACWSNKLITQLLLYGKE